MKVLVCKAPKKITIEEAKIPEIKNDKVLVKIEYCGICTYDLKRYLGLKDTNYPVILGHEPSGIVEETGSEVENFKEGDKVIVDVKIKCGKCINCLKGLESRCLNSEASNGFSQYILASQENVFKVSPNSDLVVGTLAEPLACIIHGFKKIKLRKENSFLVIGDGIMGMLASFVGKVIRNKSVTLAGHHNDRLKIAKRIGVDYVFNIKNTISKLNKFDNIVFTVEEKEIINNLNRFLYPGGNLVFIGELKGRLYNLDLNKIYSNEYILIGSKGYDREDFKISIEIIDKFSEILKGFISKIYNVNELEFALKDLKEKKILKGVLYLNN
ncbi:MAG: zinc-binding dehydrogenase [Candidatus Aminicenantia bacterium]